MFLAGYRLDLQDPRQELRGCRDSTQATIDEIGGRSTLSGDSVQGNGKSAPILHTGFVVFTESTEPIEANDLLDVLYQWAHEQSHVLTVNVEVFNIGND